MVAFSTTISIKFSFLRETEPTRVARHQACVPGQNKASLTCQTSTP
jgi:hypothetical protein